MARHAAPRSEDGARRHDTMVVLGRRLGPHENHIVPLLLERLGLIGIEDDFSRGGARRGGQTLGKHRHTGAGIDHRVKQLIQILRRYALDGFVFGDQPLVHHFDGSPNRRHSGPLRATGLQHV